MRIVQIIHGFPPYNMAGSEVYTYNLSKELAKKDEVYVFHRIANPEQEEYELGSHQYNGLNVYTINNTFKHCDSFEKTYKNDIISKKFGDFLDEVEPDITHFGHVTCLSTGLIKEAKRRNIPTVFTLHDFWLFCQLGQLLKRDLSLCHGPQESECARCLAPQLPVRWGAKKPIKAVQKTIPSFANDSVFAGIVGRVYRQYAKTRFRFEKEAKAQIQQRTTQILELCSQVHVFIAPSKFLLRKFVEFGIPEDKIVYHDYGFNTALLSHSAKVKSHKIRFGYMGTFIPSKGVHILLKAFRRIRNPNVELRIHGKFLPYHPGFEAYPDYLKSLGEQSNILWGGEYDNKDVARILSEIDILIVPSIWHENSPLTIHEAFMASVPVITSNIGGMAELVQDGRDGLHFEVGNSKDLTKKMELLIDDPAMLTRLKANIRPVIRIENHATHIRQIYRRLLTTNASNED